LSCIGKKACGFSVKIPVAQLNMRLELTAESLHQLLSRSYAVDKKFEWQSFN
jgi:hypothetical protein